MVFLKKQTYEKNYNGGYDVYDYDQYGIKQRSGTYEKNYNGGYDVYKYNQYGIKEKVGTIQR